MADTITSPELAPEDPSPEDPSPEEEWPVPERGAVGAPETFDLDGHPRAVVVGIVAIVALFLFASYALGSSLSDGEQRAPVQRVVLPRVEGRDLAAAQRQVERLGLLVSVEYQPNEVIPEGTVFDQRPIAGAKPEVGSEVTLVVSDGPAGVILPDVTGEQGAEAVELLQALGLTAELAPVHDELVRVGEVVGTVPATGSRGRPGDRVVVQISDGPAPRTVPPLVDRPVAEAMAELGRAGVGLGAVSQRYVKDKAPGLVLSSDPPAGTEVPRGEPVDVVVTGPAETIVVPSVVGLQRSSAATVVKDADLGIRVREQLLADGDTRIGRVLSQSLPAGTKVASGTTLQVVVGVAPAPPATTTTTTTTPGKTKPKD